MFRYCLNGGSCCRVYGRTFYWYMPQFKTIILIFLTGMDPVTRRLLWNVIEQKKHGRALILTTHSMVCYYSVVMRKINRINARYLGGGRSTLHESGNHGHGSITMHRKSSGNSPANSIIELSSEIGFFGKPFIYRKNKISNLIYVASA